MGLSFSMKYFSKLQNMYDPHLFLKTLHKVMRFKNKTKCSQFSQQCPKIFIFNDLSFIIITKSFFIQKVLPNCRGQRQNMHTIICKSIPKKAVSTSFKQQNSNASHKNLSICIHCISKVISYDQSYIYLTITQVCLKSCCEKL